MAPAMPEFTRKALCLTEVSRRTHYYSLQTTWEQDKYCQAPEPPPPARSLSIGLDVAQDLQHTFPTPDDGRDIVLPSWIDGPDAASDDPINSAGPCKYKDQSEHPMLPRRTREPVLHNVCQRAMLIAPGFPCFRMASIPAAARSIILRARPAYFFSTHAGLQLSSTPCLQKKIRQYPPRPTVREDEISEVFLKGSGPGGQKINKTSSAVQLKHHPTGLVVKCQSTRSRPQNRTIARRILAEKLEEMAVGPASRAATKRSEKSRKKRSREKKARRKYRELEGGRGRVVGLGEEGGEEGGNGDDGEEEDEDDGVEGEGEDEGVTIMLDGVDVTGVHGAELQKTKTKNQTKTTTTTITTTTVAEDGSGAKTTSVEVVSSEEEGDSFEDSFRAAQEEAEMLRFLREESSRSTPSSPGGGENASDVARGGKVKTTAGKISGRGEGEGEGTGR
ncbi:RF-1 domain-containing protein [Peziza echinospora]|nr:RF-1 domain-containing protein [Peziza echinospora]